MLSILLMVTSEASKYQVWLSICAERRNHSPSMVTSGHPNTDLLRSFSRKLFGRCRVINNWQYGILHGVFWCLFRWQRMTSQRLRKFPADYPHSSDSAGNKDDD